MAESAADTVKEGAKKGWEFGKEVVSQGFHPKNAFRNAGLAVAAIGIASLITLAPTLGLWGAFTKTATGGVAATWDAGGKVLSTFGAAVKGTKWKAVGDSLGAAGGAIAEGIQHAPK